MSSPRLEEEVSVVACSNLALQWGPNLQVLNLPDLLG